MNREIRHENHEGSQREITLEKEDKKEGENKKIRVRSKSGLILDSRVLFFSPSRGLIFDSSLAFIIIMISSPTQAVSFSECSVSCSLF